MVRLSTNFKRYVVILLGGAFCQGALYVTATAAEQASPPPVAFSTASENQSLSFVDHTGRRIDGLPGRGIHRLLYFGYTSCPDVCPIDLQSLSATVHALGPDAEHIQPIFITVDPKRDTPEVLAQYLNYFHPRLIGLTGTVQQIRAAKRLYAVRAMKFFPLPSEDDEAEQTEEQDNAHYVFNHTTYSYLVNPRGDVVERFERSADIGVMARKIRTHLEGS